MVNVKMIKGRSYRGAVNTNRKNPLAKCNEEVADTLIKSGFFSLAEKLVDVDEMDWKPEVSASEQFKEKSISKMNTDELVAFAEKMGVDISNCKNIEEKKALLRAASETIKVPADNGSEANQMGELLWQ